MATIARPFAERCSGSAPFRFNVDLWVPLPRPSALRVSRSSLTRCRGPRDKSRPTPRSRCAHLGRAPPRALPAIRAARRSGSCLRLCRAAPHAEAAAAAAAAVRARALGRAAEHGRGTPRRLAWQGTSYDVLSKNCRRLSTPQKPPGNPFPGTSSCMCVCVCVCVFSPRPGFLIRGCLLLKLRGYCFEPHLCGIGSAKVTSRKPLICHELADLAISWMLQSGNNKRRMSLGFKLHFASALGLFESIADAHARMHVASAPVAPPCMPRPDPC